MIKRINLIEKKPFTFTYQRLMQICLVVLALLGLFIELAIFKTQRLNKQITALQEEMAILDAKKNELTKQPVKKTVTVGEYQELFELIQSTPQWSKIVAEVGQYLPQTVWITQFEGSSSLVTVSPPDNGKQDSSNKSSTPAPVQKVSKNSLQLSGVSSDMRSITEFSSKLSQMSDLQNVTLTDAVRQGYGFVFKMKGDIVAHVR